MSLNPPYRADIVGSFLRTDAIHEARAANEAGTLDDQALRAVEDREILALLEKQHANGLRVVTDGEFRRAWWHYDFFDGLNGVDVVDSDHGIQFTGVQTKHKVLRITGPISFPADHPFLAHTRSAVHGGRSGCGCTIRRGPRPWLPASTTRVR